MTKLVALMTAALLGTLPSTTPRTDLLADGVQTTFNFSFRASSSGDVKVYVDPENDGTFVDASGYSVALTPKAPNDTMYPGGTVTFTVPPTSGKVRIEREVAISQDSLWSPYGAFKAKTLEGVLDKLVTHDQQLDLKAIDLGAKDGVLQANIDAEASSRAAADSAAASDRTAIRAAFANGDATARGYSEGLVNNEASARSAADSAIRAEVASAALGGGVSIADTSTVQARGTTITKELRDWAASLLARSRAAQGPDLSTVEIRNLSGSLHDTTSWTSSASVVTTRMSPAQFLSENPEASIPAGHVYSNGILKFEITLPTNVGSNSVTGLMLTHPAFSTLHNLTPRFYLPPAMLDRWKTINADNRIEVATMASASPAKTDWYQTWMRNDFAGMFQRAIVPSAAALPVVQSQTLSSIRATTGSPASGTLQWVKFYFAGDAAASVGTPLVLYLFDVVEIIESKPTVYFRWDDASADHRAVSLHMRQGTKFGGGALARPLPCTFGIIPSFIGGGSSLSLQNLRDMAAEGAEIVPHGYGQSGATWGSPGTSAQMISEIQATQSIIAQEGWPAEWGKVVVFPGNNFQSLTADGLSIADVAESMGLRLALGTGAGGFGHSLRAMTKPMSSLAVINIPYTVSDTNTIIDFMDKSRMSLVMMGHVVGGASPFSESAWDSVMETFANELVKPNSRIRTADLVGDAVRAGLVTN